MVEKFMNNFNKIVNWLKKPDNKRYSIFFTSVFLLILIFSAAGCTGGNSNLEPNIPPIDTPSADKTSKVSGDIKDVAPDVNTDDIMVEPGNVDDIGATKDKKKKDKKSSKDSNEDEIDIIANKTEKMVPLVVEESGRADPFLPANEAVNKDEASAQKLLELQKAKLKYDLIEPPNSAQANEDAQKVLTTTVSGIMYDQTSPSAILNIEGSDFLVRSGDVVNGYKVLAISPSVVTVQLGSNIYKAGVGQLLVTDGINYNTVPNLNKKFGGAKK